MTVLDTLRERGFLAQVSDEVGLLRAMADGPITLYQGFDPTAVSLHTGHLVGIMALAHFQRAGHRPIAVAGGGTGMIGDPTDRASERPMLSLGELERNLRGIRQQFARYLDFSDNRAVLVNNADWLLQLSYIPFLRDVGRHFTVNQLMQHGTYWERFERGSFSFIELNYALVQAYDFLHLFRAEGCVLQIGGNDQWFNILAGVDLIRRAEGRQAFALTTPLITNASGEKFGKSAGNAIWLDPELTSPYEYYQYWRNTEDADVGRFLRLFTFLPLDEIADLERLPGAEINQAKERLAFETTRITHGEQAARQAQDTARARFARSGNVIPAPSAVSGSINATLSGLTMSATGAVDTGPSQVVSEPTRVLDLALAAGLVGSRRDAKRQLEAGGLRLGDEKLSSDRLVDPSELPKLLSLGKRKIRLVAAP